MVKRIIVVLVFGAMVLALWPTVGMAQGTQEKAQPKEPLLYGLASFVLPGLGQYFNDEPGKALTHFVVALAIPVVCYYVNYSLAYYYPLYPVCGLLSLSWAAYSAMDAYQTAERFNREHGFALDPSRWRFASNGSSNE